MNEFKICINLRDLQVPYEYNVNRFKTSYTNTKVMDIQ